MNLYLIEKKGNVNDFFASGIISPQYFHEKRCFGAKRYFENSLNSRRYFLTLYKDIPNEFLKETDCLILKVSINDKNNLIKISKNIYLCIKSLYIEKNNIVLYANKEQYSSIIKNASLIREVKVRNIKKSLKLKCKINTKNIEKSNLEIDNLYKEIYMKIDSYVDKLKGYFLLNLYFNKRIFFENEEDYDLVESYENFIHILNKKDSINAKKVNDEFHSLIDENIKININLKLDIFGNVIIKDCNLNSKNIKLYNLILNILISNPMGTKGYFSKKQLEKILFAIKNNKILNFSHDELNDLNKIYSKIINEDIVSVDSINNIVFKNLYIALLKYDNLLEFESLLRKRNFELDYISISFIGIIIGYTDLSRKISDKVKNYYLNKIIENETVNIINSLENIYGINSFLKKNRVLINKLLDQDLLYKLRNNIDLNKKYDIKIKNFGSFLKITINNKFNIFLYNKIYRSKKEKFNRINNKMNLNFKNRNKKYKYFEYNIKNEFKSVNIIEDINLNIILKDIFNFIS